MKRSGHHALVLWLAGHFAQTVRHFNDAKLSPESAAQNPPADPALGRLLKGFERRTASTDPDGGECDIFSYEDLDLSRGTTTLQVPTGRTLLCLRDPYNMLASRFALWPQEVRARHQTILDLWCCHARHFLAAGGIQPVNFNAWFSSPDYRRRLSADLGLNFTDRGLIVIPPAMVGGSSFDRTEPPALRVRDLDVLGRWRRFSACGLFRSFFAGRTDVTRLAREIFGPDRDLEAWLTGGFGDGVE